MQVKIDPRTGQTKVTLTKFEKRTLATAAQIRSALLKNMDAEEVEAMVGELVGGEGEGEDDE